MGKVKQYRNVVSAFISSENGQRFFNFAYSIGAAIVIWGALFKILHLPGGNALLSIGMGTEVLMFVLTAFDRPPREYKWEQVFPVLETGDEADRPATGGTVVVGGGQAVASGSAVQSAGPAGMPAIPVTDASGNPDLVATMAAMADEMKRLHATTQALNEVSETLLASYKAITDNSASITSASAGYVDQMQALDRNLSGLNTIYEIQLRSVSGQLDAIDRVNKCIKNISDMYAKASEAGADYCAESEKMARNMQQLNTMYERMIQAMTLTMPRPVVPGAAPEAPEQ